MAKQSAVTLSDRRAGLSFISPSLLVMLALVIFPLGFGLYISFFRTNLRNQWDFVGFKFFIQSLSDPSFLKSIGITLVFAILVVLGNLVLGTVLALILNTEIRFRVLFRAILILPWLFPDVVVALIFKWIYNPLYGLLNYGLSALHLIDKPIAWLDDPNLAFAAVVISCIWKGYPLVMILVLAGLQSIPKDRYEAASLDGAGGLKSFRFVTLPGLLPVLIVSIILDTVWWFKHFTIVWLMTSGGPIDSTKVVSIDIYRVAFQNFDFGRASAMAVIVFIICLAISIIYRRLVRDNEE
ncbi:carbohydrate ABC transporter permease [Glaciibacter sp. 2TAF33]|uniref:carbohydrate ABC transporter permease n=1 Tax=Glaciibacter sp. 2TAF33 TaxID=3233015 RepID=UPI003F8F2A76